MIFYVWTYTEFCYRDPGEAGRKEGEGNIKATSVFTSNFNFETVQMLSRQKRRQ